MSQAALQKLITVKLHMLNGYHINAIKDDLITKEIMQQGTYEIELYYFLIVILKRIEQPICIDIGANIGTHTLTMAKFSSQVFAFEPIPFIYQLLEGNLKDNNITHVNTFNLALSDKQGEKFMQVNNTGNCGASSLEHSHNFSNQTKVKCEMGDEILQRFNLKKIDIIKIDIEGHETKAILGLKKTLDKHRPIVILEWNHDETRYGFTKENLFETIFKQYYVKPLISNHENFKFKSKNNYIMRPFRGILRYFYNKITPKKIIVGDFLPEANYGFLLFIPYEKWNLFQQAFMEMSQSTEPSATGVVS